MSLKSVEKRFRKRREPAGTAVEEPGPALTDRRRRPGRGVLVNEAVNAREGRGSGAKAKKREFRASENVLNAERIRSPGERAGSPDWIMALRAIPPV